MPRQAISDPLPIIPGSNSPAIPKKTRHSAQFHTPNHFTSVRHISDPQTSVLADNAPSAGTKQKQSDLEAACTAELYDATWESDDILDELCPFQNQDLLDKVHRVLKGAGFEKRDGSVNSAKIAGKGSPENKVERHWYAGFVELNNVIREALCLNTDDFHYSLYSICYDQQMQDRIDDGNYIKPDLFFALLKDEGINKYSKPTKTSTGSPAEDDAYRGMDEAKRARLPFNRPEFPAELKFDEKPLVAQLSTYTRGCFARRPYRIFCPGLAFVPKRDLARFLFYHRGGLVSSPSLDLKTKDGFCKYVKSLCGIFSWSLKDAGMDPFRTAHFHFLSVDPSSPSSNDQAESEVSARGTHRKKGEDRARDNVSLKKYVCFSVEKVLCQRNCNRGRATIVEKVTQSVVADTEDKVRTTLPEETLKHKKVVQRYTLRSCSAREANVDAVGHIMSMKPESYASIDGIMNSMSKLTISGDPTRSKPDNPVPEPSTSKSSSSQPSSSKPSPSQRSQPLIHKSDDLEDIHEETLFKQARFSQLILASGIDRKTHPETLVVKQSWTHRDPNMLNEGKVFGKKRDRFGLPNVYGWDIVGDNERLLQGKFWNIMASKNMKRPTIPEKRWLVRTWYETEGKLLSTAGTPYKLLQAVFHAVVG
jgi:hypothetical protein